jgi:uncharacterized protein involved in response to NO
MKKHLLSIPAMAFSILAITLGPSKAHEGHDAGAQVAVVAAAPVQTAASAPTAQPTAQPSVRTPTTYPSISTTLFSGGDAWWKDR